MEDKILGQISFIETDDGFRVEIKGDKERIRKMGFPPDPEKWRGMGFDPETWSKGFGRARHWHRNPWKHSHFGGFSPWMWRWGFYDDESDEYDSESEYEKPPKDA
ncbi:MAG: hypothetical protein ACK2T3_08475 [Candidatus Promineifilaceae bacterium]|jgi:hypothetical protein